MRMGDVSNDRCNPHMTLANVAEGQDNVNQYNHGAENDRSQRDGASQRGDIARVERNDTER